MSSEAQFVVVAINGWKTNIARADKTFGALTNEQLLHEVAPRKNRLIYLWGHLTAVHDLMLPLLNIGPRLHPEFDVAFISNPDKTQTSIPSVDEVRKAWNDVNAKLSEGFAKLSPGDWLQKHASVSAEDFAKEPHRNRFAVLLSRTNHLSYHLGQAALVAK